MAPSSHPWPGRTLAPGQRTQVWVADALTGEAAVVFETDEVLLEAPNCPRDSQLLLNGDGALWALPAPQAPFAGKRMDNQGVLCQIRFRGLPPINSDHVVHPNGEWILVSAEDGHIYAGPLRGGLAQRVTPRDGHRHFMHSIKPDGSAIAYMEIPDDDFTQAGQVVQKSVVGGPYHRLEGVRGHCDGPEYSPDGRWIYLNTEAFTEGPGQPGHAQIARYPASGGPLERLTSGDTADWFPHLSPSGALATYLAFPPGTLEHPADVRVQVRVVATHDWTRTLHSFTVAGGQGTLNVNSWSPLGDRFAFVAYPTAAAGPVVAGATGALAAAVPYAAPAVGLRPIPPRSPLLSCSFDDDATDHAVHRPVGRPLSRPSSATTPA